MSEFFLSSANDLNTPTSTYSSSKDESYAPLRRSSSSPLGSFSRKRKELETNSLSDFSALSLGRAHESHLPSIIGRRQFDEETVLKTAPSLAKKPPKYRRSSPLRSASTDWNHEYQWILGRPLVQRASLLAQLSDEFVERAKKIGEIIIKERNYPLSRKTIPPLNLGHCGGIKYRRDGIFFKFATDHDRLLGGDINAMKVAGHELKGLTAYSSCGMLFGISFGLMTLIDYRGYRLIATSELPINAETIVYGSSDGGHTVHSSDPDINAIIERVSKILNLKGHMCGLVSGQRGFLHSPCDLEGHLGFDGRFYMLDFARVFPPQTPNKKLVGSFLFQLLRPELVAKSMVALSSDAFSPFGACDPEAKEHDAEVEKTTNWLIEEIIPEFAQRLHTDGCPASMDLRALGSLIVQAHRAGINIRFLSLIRKILMRQYDDQQYGKLIFTELAARGLKHILRSAMRKVQSEDDDVFPPLILKFFNCVLPAVFATPATPPSAFAAQMNFWKVTVFPLMSRLYSMSMDEFPQNPIRFSSMVNGQLLFLRVQELTGISIETDSSDPMEPVELPLSNNASVKINVLEKRMYAIPRIEADGLVECGRRMTAASEKAARREYLELASSRYAKVLELKPDDYVVLTNLGAVLVDLGKDAKNLSHSLSNFHSAYQKFATALSLNKNESQTLSMWGNALYIHAVRLINYDPSLQDPHLQAKILGLLAESREKYTQALAMKSDHALLFNYGSMLLKQCKLLLAFPIISSPAERADTCRSILEQARTCFSSESKDLDTLLLRADVFLHLAKLTKDSSTRSRLLQSASHSLFSAEHIKGGSALHLLEELQKLQESYAPL